mmetsp:Transcript_14051/g.45456  ORF Transcript_14051/g.45456 Transcript_14051/m.45456 type:complete len:269 (+) Transcript_14051:266-1072(+)
MKHCGSYCAATSSANEPSLSSGGNTGTSAASPAEVSTPTAAPSPSPMPAPSPDATRSSSASPPVAAAPREPTAGWATPAPASPGADTPKPGGGPRVGLLLLMLLMLISLLLMLLPFLLVDAVGNSASTLNIWPRSMPKAAGCSLRRWPMATFTAMKRLVPSTSSWTPGWYFSTPVSKCTSALSKAAAVRDASLQRWSFATMGRNHRARLRKATNMSSAVRRTIETTTSSMPDRSSTAGSRAIHLAMPVFFGANAPRIPSCVCRAKLSL